MDLKVISALEHINYNLSFINLGFKTIVVCVNERYLDKKLCVRSSFDDLPDNVDVCGENGEFTFTFDGPLFSNLYF
jgi:diphthamide synthase (EF-2-diphthine--ammonia ligase)